MQHFDETMEIRTCAFFLRTANGEVLTHFDAAGVLDALLSREVELAPVGCELVRLADGAVVALRDREGAWVRGQPAGKAAA